MKQFYLGAGWPHWLAKMSVPLFVSRRGLAKRTMLPLAACVWALDSGAFTELSQHGAWQLSPRVYGEEVRRYQRDIGGLEWAAPQDWMCEPMMLKRTGSTVLAHQHNTVRNYLMLRCFDPDLPFIPVLQGWAPDDYMRCVEMYDQAGIDLRAVPLVGLGSVCRRQRTIELEQIVEPLARLGLRLHGFGVKALGLQRCQDYFESADSMAWSFQARRHQHPFFRNCYGHKNCANCPRYALHWRHELLASLQAGRSQNNWVSRAS